MDTFFGSYFDTVRLMLEKYDRELYSVFCKANIQEHFVPHDGWNDGIDYYNLVLSVSVELFESLRNQGKLEDAENTILGFYTDAMRGDGESIQLNGFFIKPVAGAAPEFDNMVDDSMWKPGFFRLFISHITGMKESASNLKKCSLKYGIDCFVAHEDITPSKQWVVELENALFTMDALCAIISPDFKKSLWCDQEVGMALGQKKLVIPINKGEVPYGFFGKYQALISKDKTADLVAKDIINALLNHDSTRSLYLNRLISLILNATNTNDAKQFINVLASLRQVDKRFIEQLHSNLSENKVLNNIDILNEANAIFKKYSLTPLTVQSVQKIDSIEDELPF